MSLSNLITPTMALTLAISLISFNVSNIESVGFKQENITVTPSITINGDNNTVNNITINNIH